jgi:hypothetical protein
MTVTYITPMEGYVNRRTGEYRLFPWGRRPKSPDWQPVGLDPTRGGPNMHWGWVHVTDPKTGESKWIPGWKLGPDPGRPAPGSDSIPGPAPHWTLEQLLRELRRAGIDVDRLLSMAGVDPSRPLAELYAEAGPAGARILGDRLAEALSAGLAERRAAAAVAGAALPPPRQDLAFVDRPVQPVRQPSG